MCRSVGKGWLLLWKIWLRSFVIDCCSQVLAHAFTRALDVFAEFNSFAMFISASFKMFSRSCSPHRIIAGWDILVVEPIIWNIPFEELWGLFICHRSSQIMSGPFSFLTLVWVTCCRYCGQLRHSLSKRILCALSPRNILYTPSL